jgi:hypothetical protein
MSCFFILSFHFFFYKIGEQEGRTSPACWHPWEGEVLGKGDRRANMAQKTCTHVYKWKMIPVKTTPGIGRRRDKGEWWIQV